jgi:hypothetical protein
MSCQTDAPAPIKYEAVVPHMRSGRFAEQKDLLPLLGPTARILAAVPTEPFRLVTQNRHLHVQENTEQIKILLTAFSVNL